MKAPKTIVRKAPPKAPPFAIQVRTLTGLEGMLAEELTALGASDVQIAKRVVLGKGDLGILYKANVFCRLAIRVLRPIASFPAKSEKALYEGMRAIDWSPWLNPRGTLAIDAHVHSSFTTHSLFLSQLAKDAIVDQFRERTDTRPSVDLENPDLRLSLSLFQDRAEVALDASGESLHRRGYRKKAGEAPLNEVLAAGILRLSGWSGEGVLVDPMCGAGTFLIEAGLVTRNIAPGLLRTTFGFQKWKDFSARIYAQVMDEARAAVRPASAHIVGLEIDPRVAAIARENIERAGLSDLVRVDTADFFAAAPPSINPGRLVMNPPYDERLPVDNVAELYQRIGDRLKQNYAGWTAQVLSGNLDAVKYLGLRTAKRTLLFNGATECRLLEYELNEATGESPRPPRRIAPSHPKWDEKAQVFANRIRKNFKNGIKRAEREKITCWRVYNWDVPELPFYVDLYGDRLHFAEVVRNQDHSPLEHPHFIQRMIDAAVAELGIDPKNVYFKRRKPQQSGGFQYTPHAATGELIPVEEGGHRFLVNLADYLDVGLFLDHRRTRAWVEAETRDKDFLNLFAYTGSFSVYAAAGGARSTTTVDTSHTYLDWARENMRLNGFEGRSHRFIRRDVLQFLATTSDRFDICVVDPPTRSVNRSSERVFDVQVDHVELLRRVMQRMRPGGKIFFSTNYRTFEIDDQRLQEGNSVELEEITAKTLAFDFARKPNHRAWLIHIH